MLLPKTVNDQSSLFPEQDQYAAFLTNLKSRIQQAQVKAALAVNQELIQLYWQIGRDILERQQQEGWGAKVITQLATDLKKAFPDMKGFSRSNLFYMRAFAEAYPDEEFVHQLGGQIPWKHNCILLDKEKDSQARIWYIQQTILNGWSRNILALQIDSNLYQRQGEAITNFERTLPPEQSDLRSSILKDPYCFDFLTIDNDAKEAELERGLVSHIRDFLMELGVGFAFLGSQYPIEVSGKEYRLDLLFYHVQLHCYVVIDLKMTEFEPQHSGQMSFYVAAVDNLLRTERDEPTIGIILCRSKDKTTVEYALQGSNQPIGVASYQLQGGDRQLPEEIQSKLPTPQQLEMEMEAALSEMEASESEEK